MNHIFCTECGSKIEYSYSKPKFCSSCGSKCGGGLIANDSQFTPRSKTQRPSSFMGELERTEESLAEDETSVDEVPYIQGLAVETESHGNNVFSFESLVGEEDRSPKVRNRGSRNIEDFINDRRG